MGLAKGERAAILAELARREGGHEAQSIPEAPAAAVVSPPLPPAPAAPPMSQAPLGISRRLAQALTLAEHYHISFWFDEVGVFITRAPPDYRREIQEAERALMSAGPEINMICKLPERPKHYEDAAWVRAIADSARLGYRSWKE